MADYINENILCQAYIHVEPEEITDELISELKHNITEFVKSRSEFFIYPNAEVNIEFKDGSIRVYATILGTVAMLYSSAAGSDKFKHNAGAMYEDVKRLSDNIVTESIFLTRTKHNQILRVEARTGVVGSIKKIVTRLDSIKLRNGSVYADTLATQIYNAADEIQILLGNIKADTDKNLLVNGFLEQVNEFPKIPSAPLRKTNSDEQIKLYYESVKFIKGILNNKTLPIYVSKENLDDVTDMLHNGEVKYLAHQPRPDHPAPSYSMIAIIQSTAMWGALAAIIIAFINNKSGRKVTITTKDGASIQAEGLTKEELAPILKKAKKLTANNSNKKQ